MEGIAVISKGSTWLVIAVLGSILASANGQNQQVDGSQPVQKSSEAKEFSKHVVVIIGAAGEASYGKQFEAWAGHWSEAAKNAGARFTKIGGQPKVESGEESDAKSAADPTTNSRPRDDGSANADESKTVSDRERFKKWIEDIEDKKPVWIVLIGHGTFDGKSTAKFNLTGPDISAVEISNWLKPLANSVVLINCASSSGPFVNQISGPNRIVISSTKSGFQHNFSRFGQFISKAITDPSIDLDKDGQTSLLEAFLAASNRTEEFYKSESRLASEHALLDDNGDGLGTQAEWFTGIRVTKKAKPGSIPDGPRANQVFLMPPNEQSQLTGAAKTRHDQLELEFEKIRAAKSTMLEADYYRKLEAVLLEIAELYESAQSAKKK